MAIIPRGKKALIYGIHYQIYFKDDKDVNTFKRMIVKYVTDFILFLELYTISPLYQGSQFVFVIKFQVISRSKRSFSRL